LPDEFQLRKCQHIKNRSLQLQDKTVKNAHRNGHLRRFFHPAKYL
jgi:hypothetical protein